MEEEERNKRYFMEQYVLNQAYTALNIIPSIAAEDANIAWEAIQKLLVEPNNT